MNNWTWNTYARNNNLLSTSVHKYDHHHWCSNLPGGSMPAVSAASTVSTRSVDTSRTSTVSIGNTEKWKENYYTLRLVRWSFVLTASNRTHGRACSPKWTWWHPRYSDIELMKFHSFWSFRVGRTGKVTTTPWNALRRSFVLSTLWSFWTGSMLYM